MAILRKDKLLAGDYGNLESVVIHDNAGANKVQTTNGVFVVVEGLMAGEREAKKGRLGAVADVAKDLFVIHNPEVMYDERKYKLSDYRIEAGKLARAYRLYDGDILTLTVDLFADATPDANGVPTVGYAVGDRLIIKANGLLGKGDATQTGNAKIVFDVIEDSGYELSTKMKSLAVQVTRQK